MNARDVHALFDLAGGLANPTVATLQIKPPQQQQQQRQHFISLSADDVKLILGRSSALPVAHRLSSTSKRISAFHCRFSVNATTWTVTITDTKSTNGVWVNGERLQSENPRDLCDDDVIDLIDPSKEEEVADKTGPTRFFFSYEKRSDIESIGATAQFDESLSSKRQREEGSDDYDDAATSSCSGGSQVAMSSLQRISGTPIFCKLPQRIVPQLTRFCKKGTKHESGGKTPADKISAFCSPWMMHLSCKTCSTSFPSFDVCDVIARATSSASTSSSGGRNGHPHSCQMCNAAYCAAHRQEEIKKLRDFQFTEIPDNVFSGNQVERDVLLRYVANKQRTGKVDEGPIIQLVQSVWEACLEKMRCGEWKPDIPLLAGSTACAEGNFFVCRSCATHIFGTLLFNYRRAIPMSELPPEVTARGDCWRGLYCRTQFENLTHAHEYNHACPAVKRKE